jgi:hypothetical protein
MIETQPASERLGRRIFRPALIVGAIGLALCVVGGFVDPTQAFRSYLMAYTLWLDLPLGCLALSLIQFMTGGAWGLAIRRIVEAGARTMPLMALLFIPIFFGLPRIYLWARPEVVAQDPLLQHKSLYLNSAGYIIRAVVYFAAWSALATYLGRWSAEQDRSGDPRLLGKLQRLSIGGAVLLGLTASFAAIDWLMSLEPDWYSTVYGAIVAWGTVLTSMCFAIVALVLLAGRGASGTLARVLSPQLLNELGSLLLAFLILWSYMAYFQYLLIFAGNLNEEIPWFLRRTTGEWLPIALIVVFGTFATPFFLLLFRDLKRNPRTLAAIAAVLLITRPIDMFWLVKPAFVTEGWLLHWLDVAAAVGLGGIWLAAFTWRLAQRPLLPPNDPRLPAAMEALHGRA